MFGLGRARLFQLRSHIELCRKSITTWVPDVSYRTPRIVEFLESSVEQRRVKLVPLPSNIQECKYLTNVRLSLEQNYHQLIKDALDLDQPTIAHDLFTEYWNLDIQPPSRRIMCLLFKIHQKLGLKELLVQDMDLISSHISGLSMDSATQIVAAFSVCQDFQKAESIFRWLQSHVGFLSVHTYNALLGCADAFQAQNIVQEMRAANINPNLSTYEALIKIYGEHGNERGLEPLLQEMVEDNVLPTSEFLSEYLQALCSIPNYSNKRKAEEVYRILDEVGLVPEQGLFNAFALYYSVAHSPEKSLEFIEVCQDNGTIDGETYWAVFQGYYNNGDFEGGLRLLREKGEFIEGSTLEEAYNCLIEIAIEQEQAQKGCTTILLISEMKMSVREDLYDPLLFIMLKDETTNFSLTTEVWKQADALDAPLKGETMSLMILRADELNMRENVSAFLAYMYDNEMEISEELVAVYNKPVSNVVDESAFRME